MEKNIHDDRLDDFVKKSFDGYSEEPGMDMWDRIEVGLPPEEPGKPWALHGVATDGNWRLLLSSFY